MEAIIQAIDTEISKLQKVRELLDGEFKPPMNESNPDLHLVSKKRHKMSAEGRAKIAAAARLRWKKQRSLTKQAA